MRRDARSRAYADVGCGSGRLAKPLSTYLTGRYLGTDLVPTTVGRDDAPFGPGSFQWWVEDNGEDHYFTLRERPEFHDWFARLAAFDVIANNADRKSGHVLFDESRLWAIDNGLCFHEEDKLRTVIWEYAGLAVEERLLQRIDRFAKGEIGRVGEWLNPSEVALAQLRAHGLVENALYPSPDETSDWPPYPWPLI